MATRVDEQQEEESAASTGFLRRVITACGPSAWRASAASSYVVAAEAGGGAGGLLEMGILPEYQRLSNTCDATLPDDDSGDYGARSSACPPRAARVMWGKVIGAVTRGRGGDVEEEPSGVLRKERRQSSWRPDPDRRWPVQGWC